MYVSGADQGAEITKKPVKMYVKTYSGELPALKSVSLYGKKLTELCKNVSMYDSWSIDIYGEPFRMRDENGLKHVSLYGKASISSKKMYGCTIKLAENHRKMFQCTVKSGGLIRKMYGCTINGGVSYER